MKKNLSTILLVAVLIVGVGLLVYPSLSDYWNSFHQTRAIASYSDAVSTMDNADYDRIWSEAEAYNAALAEKANPYFFTEEDQKLYEDRLNISGTGVMGYIDIPEIKCTLPIYHGTSHAVLQIAVVLALLDGQIAHLRRQDDAYLVYLVGQRLIQYLEQEGLQRRPGGKGQSLLFYRRRSEAL